MGMGMGSVLGLVLGGGMACSKPGFWFWSSFCRFYSVFLFFRFLFWFTPLFVCCQQNVFTPTWPGEDFFWAFSSLLWFIRCFSACCIKRAAGAVLTGLFVLIKIPTLINRQGPYRKLGKCSWRRVTLMPQHLNEFQDEQRRVGVRVVWVRRALVHNWFSIKQIETLAQSLS